MNIKEFLASDELEAFIIGPAGSGKTTKLKEVVETLNSLGVVYLVTAYTHKAKDVLISKLPAGTPVTTLHSWLKKIPGINEKAKKLSHIMVNMQVGKPVPLQLLIVDEYSFVGEKDYFSIGEYQDELNLEDMKDSRGKPLKPLKVLYVGDKNQLPPVGDVQAINPSGSFIERLTTIHRTTSTISQPLAELVEMLEGKRKPGYLSPTPDFIREVDIDALYKIDKSPDKIMLAFTNKAVEAHNKAIQGYDFPKEGDILYSATLKRELEFQGTIKPAYIDKLLTPRGFIDHETPYNPLKTLFQMGYVEYFKTQVGIVPVIWGSYNNKLIREDLGNRLVTHNKNESPKAKITYKEYKTVNDYVAMADFNHCMTIHKSQGSEYERVYVDNADLALCQSLTDRLKLLYTAMSRAKDKIFMNN